MLLQGSVWQGGLCALWVTRQGEVLAGHRVAFHPSTYLHCIWRNGRPGSEGDETKHRTEYFLKEQKHKLKKCTVELSRGVPGGPDSKESACNVGDPGSIPGLGRSPRERNGYPLQYSGLQNSMDCIVHRMAKSQTRLNDFHSCTQC